MALGSTAVILHLYYVDLWPEFQAYLQRLKTVDLYVSIPSTVPGATKVITEIRTTYPRAHIFRFENRGQDVLPFLRILSAIKNLPYEFVLKIHSKGADPAWRRILLERLTGHADRVMALFNADPTIGMISAKEYLFLNRDYWFNTKATVMALASQLSDRDPGRTRFAAGTMFWFRPRAMDPLLSLGLTDRDFAEERGQRDGETQHAVERLTVLSCEVAGLRCEGI